MGHVEAHLAYPDKRSYADIHHISVLNAPMREERRRTELPYGYLPKPLNTDHRNRMRRPPRRQ